MKIRRLFSVGPAELACRGRQKALKWIDRMSAHHEPSSILRREGRADEREIERLEGKLRDRVELIAAEWFFAGTGDRRLSKFIEAHLAGNMAQTLASAEALIQRHFDLLGYRGLFFGNPPDWHLDPISGRRAPLVHWSLIDALDSVAVGDHKVIWELNRHQWLIPLGQAYQFTKDERYAEAFAAYVRDWIRCNPPGMGINWASSLEVALRLISWCWALILFRKAKALSTDLFLSMLKGIAAHARHVEKYLSYYFSPNTHLTGEALGLFYAGIAFPFLKSGERWRALGAQILVNQSQRQILPDGVHFELSTCYQRYMIETYLHFVILAEKNAIDFPPSVRERVQHMLDFLLIVRSPDSSIPQIGDTDGGRLLPLSSRGSEDHKKEEVFSTAAVLFCRADYAWASGGLAADTVWLLGSDQAQTFCHIPPAPPVGKSSVLFRDAGYAVMRSGWDEEAHHLIFDVGALGCPISSGHGHADLLSIQCSVFGEPYLVDPGTYCYTADQSWRDFFRSTAAHSTVIVDRANQALTAGPFAWKSRPRASLRQWISTEKYDLADAQHDAYACLPDPVVHRRRVIFVKPRYWIIVDDLNGAEEHRIDLRFQFAPMKVTMGHSSWARANGLRGSGLLLHPFSRIPLKGEIYKGEMTVIQGWISSNYGQRCPAPVVSYTGVTRLPFRIATLVFPVRNQLDRPPTVRQLFGPEDELVGLVIGQQETIHFREGDVVMTLGKESET